MKCQDKQQKDHEQWSLPPRGAWIEMQWHLAETYDKPRRSPHGERGLKSDCKTLSISAEMSLPPRGAWIEILFCDVVTSKLSESLPPRGAWIEISQLESTGLQYNVAPPTGSVD